MPPAAASRVLVVEDDFDIRDALTQILRDEGYDASGAANGAEALAQLRAAPAGVALILLDLMMPVMDGEQFRTAQLEDPRLAPIPVVILSADASAPQRAAATNAAGCLRKPVQLDALLDLVARFAAPHPPG